LAKAREGKQRKSKSKGRVKAKVKIKRAFFPFFPLLLQSKEKEESLTLVTAGQTFVRGLLVPFFPLLLQSKAKEESLTLVTATFVRGPQVPRREGGK